MQLAAFDENNFMFGYAGMAIGEGLPQYMVSRIQKEHALTEMTVGLLGMAFKAESDDVRSSLSYKLKRLLKFKAKTSCAPNKTTNQAGTLPFVLRCKTFCGPKGDL